MKTAYPIIISPDTDGWHVSVPDMGLQTQERSIAEAIDEAGHMSTDGIEMDIEDALRRQYAASGFQGHSQSCRKYQGSMNDNSFITSGG